MRHLVIEGIIVWAAAADATADFVDLSDDDERLLQETFAAGGIMLEDMTVVTDPETVGEKMALLFAAIPEHPYFAARMA